MSISRRPRKKRGFTLLGVVVTVAILGTLSVALPLMLAANQSTRTHQLHMAQAFYATHAGLEFSSRQILVDGQSWQCNFPERDFNGEALAIARNLGRLSVTATKSEARRTFSITDPTPPAPVCLDVDGSGATVSPGSNKLEGITFNRIAACGCPITIDSITVTWAPDANEKLNKIRMDGSLVYNYSPGIPSGSTAVLDTPFTIVLGDLSSHDLTDLQFQKKIDDVTTFTLVFNLNDGTSKSVDVNF